MTDSNNDRLSELRKKAASMARTAANGPGSEPIDEGKINYRPVAERPRGTKLVVHEPDRVVLQFKAALRFWWPLPYVMLAATIGLSLPLGMFVGTFLNPYLMYDTQAYQAFFGSALWLTPVILAIATFVSFRITQPWVTVVATRRYIRIGDMIFDPKNYAGLRIGYEIPVEHGILKNDFFDVSLGLQGLRAAYGHWGEDLPYLVSRYHAAEMVLWMNMYIEAGRNPDAASDQAAQEPDQVF